MHVTDELKADEMKKIEEYMTRMDKAEGVTYWERKKSDTITSQKRLSQQKARSYPGLLLHQLGVLMLIVRKGTYYRTVFSE